MKNKIMKTIRINFSSTHVLSLVVHFVFWSVSRLQSRRLRGLRVGREGRGVDGGEYVPARTKWTNLAQLT